MVVVWFIWDPLLFITFYVASFIFWYIARKGRMVTDNDDGTTTVIKIRNPFWIGLSIACFSFFAIGLYSLILIFVYILSVVLTRSFRKESE